MKFKEIAESITSGSVATVATPIGGTQTRGKGVYPNEKGGNLLTGKKTNKKYANSLKESANVNEEELQEDDLILVPGQGHRLKSGFVPHGQSRVDHEVEMARSDLFSSAKNARAVYELIKDRSEDDGLEGWVQEKIIKANDYLNSVREYLEGKQMQEAGVIAAGGVGEGVAEGSQLDEISANPDYLRAAERSRSQAQATQRTFGKSPEEKAAARRTELKRDRGIAGYTKRHRVAHPEMYPTPKAQPAPQLRDPSTEYSDDYNTWAAGRRDTQEQGVAEGEVKQFPKKHRGDLEDTHSCVKCGGDLQGGTYMGHKVKVCVPCKQVYLPPNTGIDKRGNKIEEYGDTAKGQKMLDKVHHRAANRVTSKQADKDPAYARRAQQTQDRAWDRIKDKDVAEGSINEFAPTDDGNNKNYEYEVYQCNPNDQFDWIGGPIYKTDDMGEAHSVAYNLHKKHPNKAFMIWQERSQGSRGGYGIKDDEQGVAEGAPELLKQEMPLVRHIEKELEQHGYEKGTPEYNEMFKHSIAMYRKFGNIDAIRKAMSEEQAPMFTPEEKIVNMNDKKSDGWRVYKAKPAGTKESSIMKGLQNEVSKHGSPKGK